MNKTIFNEYLEHLEKFGCEYLEEVGYINIDLVDHLDEYLEALETYYNKEFYITTNNNYKRVIKEYK